MSPDFDDAHVLTPERPFPGPRAYTEPQPDEPRYFWGRDAETEELLRLVQAETLTVLFGASGTGKTSLLAAGLFPRLRAKALLPVRVRFDFDAKASAPPLDLVQQTMAAVVDAAKRADLELERADARSSLWEFFQTLEIWTRSAELLTPVLVLDQFEEVFTLGVGAAARQNEAVLSLFRALGSLSENWMPSRAVAVSAGAAALDWRSFQGGQAPLVKVVLSLREEFLPDLEALRRSMPLVMRNRMRLLPLRGSVAKTTLLQIAPALMTGEVAERIVRAVTLARRDGQDGRSLPEREDDRPLDEISVEPWLLNLFCYQLNERRLRDSRRPGVVVAGPAVIDADLVQRERTRILDGFYEACLDGLSSSVRRFVERRLLSKGGYRLPVPLRDVLARKELKQRELDTLETRRLIRRERRGDVEYLELVHDVLADSIAKAIVRRRELSAKRIGQAVVAGTVLSLAVAFLLANLRGWQVLSILDVQVAEKQDQLRQTTTAVALVEKEAALARSERDRAQQEREDAHRESVAARNDLDAAVAEKKRAEDAARISAAKAAAALARADEVTERLDAQRLELERTAKELADQRAELAHAKAELERVKGERDHLEKKQGIPQKLEFD